jgi:hypothetical protein
MIDVQGLSKIKELIVWSWTYLWALWFLLVIKKTVWELFPHTLPVSYLKSVSNTLPEHLF